VASYTINDAAVELAAHDLLQELDAAAGIG
jgi:hypothetical protein